MECHNHMWPPEEGPSSLDTLRDGSCVKGQYMGTSQGTSQWKQEGDSV